MSIEETSYTPLHRYVLEIAYDGTNYSGWQIQPHCVAVQEIVQEKLSKLFNKLPIHVIGCSRTDAGVHAQGFVGTFLTPERPDIPPEKVQKALNRLLPPDIKIKSIKVVPLEFHARYDTFGKAYTYILNLGNDTPFLCNYSWRSPHRLDVEKIRAAAARLTGKNDYSSFVVERSNIDDAVRTIFRIEVQQFDEFCCVTFVGDGFLYKMIRCLMGTLEAAGAGKLTPDDVSRILQAKNRSAAPETAPPEGLFLMKVFYSEEERTNFKLEKLPFLYN